MKILKNLFLVLVLITVASCSEDNNDNIDTPEEAVANEQLTTQLGRYAARANATNQQADYLNDGECFTLNFPYSFTDGTTETVINSDEEVEAYFENLDPTALFDYVYPLTATLADGSTQVLNNSDDFIELLFSCYGDDVVEGECFTINFPVTALDVDGNEIIANDEFELFTNPNIVAFVFPIDVTLEDGSVATVNSDEDFDALYNDCYGIEGCDDCGTYENCFTIGYPLNIVLEDGSIVTIENDDDFVAFMETVDEETIFSLGYPLTLEYDDGSTVIVNNDDEFMAELESCE